MSISWNLSINVGSSPTFSVQTGPPEQTDPPKVFSWDKSDRPDAKDFVFKDLKSECKVKAPGSVPSAFMIMGTIFGVQHLCNCVPQVNTRTAVHH